MSVWIIIEIDCRAPNASRLVGVFDDEETATVVRETTADSLLSPDRDVLMFCGTIDQPGGCLVRAGVWSALDHHHAAM